MINNKYKNSVSMNKKIIEILIEILYVCAVFGFLTYLSIKKSAFMFCGGLFLIVASIMSIINSKSNK